MPKTFTRHVNGATLDANDPNELQVAIEFDTKGIWNVVEYGATPDRYLEDGILVGSSTTFSSASAGFTSGDVGKILLIFKWGPSGLQDEPFHTTISSVTDGTHVVMSTNPSWFAGTKSNVHFAVSAGDQTTFFQNAINAAGSAGGGRVFVPAGVWTIGTINLKNKVWLMGAGLRNTYLHLKNSVNASTIKNDTVGGGSSVMTAEMCGVLHLTVDGNRSNQSSGTGHGITFTQNTAGTEQSEDENADTWHTVQSVWITNCHDNGFNSAGSSQARLWHVYATFCSGHGFAPAGDTLLVGCSASRCAGKGFELAGNSNRLVGCKSSLNAVGFHANAVFQGATVLTECEAQDNTNQGFLLDGFTSRCSLVGCVADSNSTSGTASFAGYEINSSNDNVIEGCISMERNGNAGGGTGKQLNALKIDTASKRNRVRIYHGAVYAGISGQNSATQTLPGTPLFSGSSATGNDVVFNGNERGYISIGANQWETSNTFTPRIYDAATYELNANTTTVAYTLAAPCCFLNAWNQGSNPSTPVPDAQAPGHKGAKLRLSFVQGATSASTVTWNGVYKRVINGTTFDVGTTLSKRTVFDFECYDGTNWQLVNCSQNVG